MTANSTDRIRALHVARRFAPMVGGIERYIRDLAAAQVRHGIAASVVTLQRDVIGVHQGRLPRKDVIDGIRVLRVPGLGGQRFAVCLRPDILIREVIRADVVHIHDLRFMTGIVCLAAVAARRPVIFHTHGLLFHTDWAVRLKRLLIRFYFGPLLRMSRATIVASSDHDRELLLKSAPYLAGQAVTFENAIDLERFRSTERHPEPGLILVIGRVARRKGIDRLLVALARLKHRSEWHLKIAGSIDEPEHENLTELARKLGIEERIEFTGVYSDAAHTELLSHAQMAVFPSRAEGFGLALVEAMAAGVPVLVSDIPAHRQVLGSALSSALVDFERSEEAAAAIERALIDTQNGGPDGSSTVQNRAAAFDIERLLEQTRALYERLGANTVSQT